jgi:hypothetical protein
MRAREAQAFVVEEFSAQGVTGCAMMRATARAAAATSA